MKGISFEINKETLRSPKYRLVLCVLALILGLLCVKGNMTEEGTFRREDMTPVTTVFKDCRFYSNTGTGSVNANSIYLVFEDGERLYIHKNCATDELTQRLFDLDAGAEAEMLVDEATKNITELIINGDTWLSFDTVQYKMNRLEVVLEWAGYAMLAASAALAVSLVPVLVRMLRKEEAE